MELELAAKGKFHFGGGRRSAAFEARGGAVGLIIDARGRPLPDGCSSLDVYPKRGG